MNVEKILYRKNLSLFYLRSFLAIFEEISKILSLAVKNIEVNFMFFARLFVSLFQIIIP